MENLIKRGQASELQICEHLHGHIAKMVKKAWISLIVRGYTLDESWKRCDRFEVTCRRLAQQLKLRKCELPQAICDLQLEIDTTFQREKDRLKMKKKAARKAEKDLIAQQKKEQALLRNRQRPLMTSHSPLASV